MPAATVPHSCAPLLPPATEAWRTLIARAGRHGCSASAASHQRHLPAEKEKLAISCIGMRGQYADRGPVTVTNGIAPEEFHRQPTGPAHLAHYRSTGDRSIGKLVDTEKPKKARAGPSAANAIWQAVLSESVASKDHLPPLDASARPDRPADPSSSHPCKDFTTCSETWQRSLVTALRQS